MISAGLGDGTCHTCGATVLINEYGEIADGHVTMTCVALMLRDIRDALRAIAEAVKK